MNVLLADFDLFATTGGGQTFYRSIIEKNPSIRFHYLSVAEPANVTRPPNAVAISYRERYSAASWKDYCDIAPPRWALPPLVRANNVAHSLRGREFDVVDLPDYEQFGAFLRPAFERHGVQAERIALSLHGRISTTISMNWGTEGRPPRDIEATEDLQYQVVDLRYGLSRAYLDEWNAKFNLRSHYLSPWHFLGSSTPTRTTPCLQRANLQFIGRTEKRKGPDIFAEIALWLPRDSYQEALIVGPQNWDPQGRGSNYYLRKMLKNRGASDAVSIVPTANRADLARLFASRAITVLPSRYDTFNLVAVESLLAGCPVAIGSGAGVCRFLEQSLPEVPFIKIPTVDWHACIGQLAEALNDYDDYRNRVVDAVLSANRAPDGPDLAEIYRSSPQFSNGAREEAGEWYQRLMHHEQPRSIAVRVSPYRNAKEFVKARTTPEFRRRLRALHPQRALASTKSALKDRLSAGFLRSHLTAGRVLTQAETFLRRYRHIYRLSERTDSEIDAKSQLYGELIANIRADRIRLWRELARVETLRNDPLAAATYRLRAMRLAGADRYDDLPVVVPILEQHGYQREAEVAVAMFGKSDSREEHCSRLLDEAFAVHRRQRQWQYESVDDRREKLQSFRVSIIVSLYNAADKLPFFLRALSRQTLLQRGQAEVVLIDSGSPAGEYSVFKNMIGELPISIVYARSAERETIQSAWNRGISLSRGEYLCFLGVDEGILPRALEILASELDADPKLDWVQANSLVTNVNAQGWWLNDIMTYDRADYSQSLVYLDTCYLSWVGALYRKSIHQRCGYYDPTFGAAGDTEFKNRVLPFIKSKTIPQMLGVFWNYPSGQTTCSPRAEIEDLRAWYLHRTLAGVRYAFGRRDPAEAEDLLYATLRYRKSYCQHWSTDVEYAYNLARFLRERREDSPAEALFDGIANLLGTYRSLDYLPKIAHSSLVWSLSRAFYVAHKESRRHFEISGERVRPAYQVFNDNRHEQHTQLWGKAA